ncbi:hypothetical protein BGX26_006777 [Mortierella sp. AD094]|nr:hypothetical protein BGX26_006777 [Mortierella sp. AD094]
MAVLEAVQHSNTSAPPESGIHRDGNHHPPRHGLQPRDIFDDIIGWFDDAFGTLACDAFAVLGVGPFDAVAAIFEATNFGGVGLTDDQLFFAQAAMGYVPPGIDVYYGANFGPGFDSAIGTTFLQSIYPRSTGNTIDTTPATDLANIGDSFAAITHTTVHETWHVRQYESHGFDLSSFAYDYLYGFCQDGLSYWNDLFEVDARNVADSINFLLSRFLQNLAPGESQIRPQVPDILEYRVLDLDSDGGDNRSASLPERDSRNPVSV